MPFEEIQIFIYFYFSYSLSKFYLSQSNLINFHLDLNSSYLNVFNFKKYLYLQMCSIGIKSGLQMGLFLRSNAVVNFKSIPNSYNTKYFVRFK